MYLRQGSTLQGGKFRIIRVLGQGGFGITYLAEHTMLDKLVAIKEFFPKEYCDRDENTSHLTIGTKNSIDIVDTLKGKFVKEAKNISKLRHPNIITIHDIFQENETAYYVMEYVEGVSLSQMVVESGAMSESKALGYISKVAEAVGYMHSQSMNHLDLKPSNIMIRRADDEPVLIDFGLSKQYDASGGQTSTTPVGISHGYAPIEQYRPGGVSTFTPQTDVYALGATLLALLTGTTPPHYSDILEDGLPQFPPSISAVTRNAVAHAMAMKKNNRPASTSQFLDELSVALSSAPAESRQQLSSEPYIVSSATGDDDVSSNNEERESAPEAVEETVILAMVSVDAPKTNNGPLDKIETSSEKATDFEDSSSRNINIDGVEFVDLGLSVLWANKNIGADTPAEIGTFVDSRISGDEVRAVNELISKGAKIPTIAQWEELRTQCRWEVNELEGVAGYLVTGKNGKSIFIPFNGNEEISFRTFGRLFTRESFFRSSVPDSEKHNSFDKNNCYFYFTRYGNQNVTAYNSHYKCPVRLIYGS